MGASKSGKGRTVAKVLVGVWVQLVSLSAFAVAPPPETARYLTEVEHRADLVDRFRRIEEVTPQEFVRRLRESGAHTVAGAGYNGIAFFDSEDRLPKLTFSIYAAVGLAELNPHVARVTPEQLREMSARWADIVTVPGIATVDISAARGRNDKQLGSQPAGEDLVGTLLWAAFSPDYEEFPDMVTDDGQAWRGRKHEGVQLFKILQSQREGTPLHKNYNMNVIWREVIRVLRATSVMLQRTGVTIDTFAATNFLIQGTGNQIKVRMVDHALATPTPEVRAYYESQGIHIPDPIIKTDVKLIQWPAHHDIAVFNGLWALSYQQSVDYFMSYYGYKTREEAVSHMAHVPRWVIVEAPFLADYSHIDRAIRATYLWEDVKHELKNMAQCIKSLMPKGFAKQK